MLQVDSLDHLVLTVKDIAATVEFYTSIMGMEKVEFGDNRVALNFGQQKINLHKVGNEFKPKAHHACPGSADLCFIITTPVLAVIPELKAKGVQVIAGPVYRTGATGKIISAYFRDPDGNLLEVSNYVTA